METKTECSKKILSSVVDNPSLVSQYTSNSTSKKNTYTTNELDSEVQTILDFGAQRVEAARSLIETLNTAEEEIIQEIRMTETLLIENGKLKDGAVLRETPYLTINTSREEHFCVCRGSNVGQMVNCDNPSCPFQWFHIECVGLASLPENNWLCPYCSSLMKDVCDDRKQQSNKDKDEKGKNDLL